MARSDDIARLTALAGDIEAAEAHLAGLHAERTKIWRRRLADTSKAELARLSWCSTANIRFWLSKR